MKGFNGFCSRLLFDEDDEYPKSDLPFCFYKVQTWTIDTWMLENHVNQL